MSDALPIIFTDAGLAEIVAANNGGTAPVQITHIALGSAHENVDKTTTALANEIKRIAVDSGGSVADNVIHASIEDGTADEYSAYSFGLITDSGTLLGVYSQAQPIKVKAAATLFVFAADVVITGIPPNSVTVAAPVINNPQASETVKGVMKLATQLLTDALANDNTAVTPLKLGVLLNALLANYMRSDVRGKNSNSLYVGSTNNERGAGQLEIGAADGSFSVNVQDGDGRLNMRWNATSGSAPKFLVDGDHAWELDADSAFSGTSGSNFGLTIRISTEAGVADQAITWQKLFSVGDGGIEFKGQPLMHSGNTDGFLRSDEVDSASEMLHFLGGFRAESKNVPNNGDITQRLPGGFYQYSQPTLAKGWPTEGTNWQHLLVLTHDNGENYHSMQFCGDFNTDGELFYRSTSDNGAAPWRKLWHSGNDGADSDLDADRLRGNAPAQAPQPFTICQRDTNSDLRARLFRSEYAGTNSDVGFVMTQRELGVGDNYVRPTTLTQLIAAMSANGLLTRINQATTALAEARLPFRMDQNLRTVDPAQLRQLLLDGGGLGGLLMEDGDHAINTNDGGGNWNIRIGHKYDSANGGFVYTAADKGAIHINGAHENSNPYLEIAIGEDPTGKAVGDVVTWARKFVIKSDGTITWGGQDVLHTGNANLGNATIRKTGRVTIGRVGSLRVNFAEAFPNACEGVLLTSETASWEAYDGDPGDQTGDGAVIARDAAGFDLRNNYAVNTRTYFYEALGN